MVLYYSMGEIRKIKKETIEMVDSLVFFSKDGRIFIPKRIRDSFEGYAFLPKQKENGIFLEAAEIEE